MREDTRVTPILGQLELPHPSDCPTTMDRPVVLITGANTGLGLEPSRPSSDPLEPTPSSSELATKTTPMRQSDSYGLVSPTAPQDLSIAKAFDFVAERYG